MKWCSLYGLLIQMLGGRDDPTFAVDGILDADLNEDIYSLGDILVFRNETWKVTFEKVIGSKVHLSAEEITHSGTVQ